MRASPLPELTRPSRAPGDPDSARRRAAETGHLFLTQHGARLLVVAQQGGREALVSGVCSFYATGKVRGGASLPVTMSSLHSCIPTLYTTCYIGGAEQTAFTRISGQNMKIPQICFTANILLYVLEIFGSKSDSSVSDILLFLTPSTPF